MNTDWPLKITIKNTLFITTILMDIFKNAYFLQYVMYILVST